MRFSVLALADFLHREFIRAGGGAGAAYGGGKSASGAIFFQTNSLIEMDFTRLFDLRLSIAIRN